MFFLAVGGLFFVLRWPSPGSRPTACQVFFSPQWHTLSTDNSDIQNPQYRPLARHRWYGKKVEFGILLLGMYALATWVFQDVLSFGQVMFSMVAISQSYKTTLLMTNIYGWVISTVSILQSYHTTTPPFNSKHLWLSPMSNVQCWTPTFNDKHDKHRPFACTCFWNRTHLPRF